MLTNDDGRSSGANAACEQLHVRAEGGISVSVITDTVIATRVLPMLALVERLVQEVARI